MVCAANNARVPACPYPKLRERELGTLTDTTKHTQPLTNATQACGAATAAHQTPGVCQGMGGMAGQYTAALPAAGHRLVALVVMETFVRYARVLQQSQALLPAVVLAFLDARGLGHPSEVRKGFISACLCALVYCCSSHLELELCLLWCWLFWMRVD